MKRWNNVNLDDEAKRTMSRDSENARSHPIKPVTRTACASREPDAIDDLLERSHWCFFMRLRTTSSCSLGSPALLHLIFEPESQLRRVLRTALLTTARSEMSENADLKSQGQFSASRIVLAKQVLDDTANAVITTRVPAPFRDSRATPR